MNRVLVYAAVACLGALPVVLSRGTQKPALESDGPGRSAEQVYKNIQSLKGIPSDQLIPSMQFITASLGVDCAFCHVENHFDRDDKKPKEMARKMIRMEMAINANNFDHPLKVTCNTCHRGNRVPQSIPEIGEGPASLATASLEDRNVNSPTADELIDKYVRALGGRKAIESISTLAEKGTADIAGHQVPVEILDKTPASRRIVIQFPEGDRVTAFDGQHGWFASTRRPVRAMTVAEAEDERMDADLHFALQIKHYFAGLQPASPETIRGRSAYQLLAEADGLPRARLYFDKESGLLVRLVRYGRSALGLNPTQVDYDDYQPVDGMQVARRLEIARPSGRLVIKITEAKDNADVGDSVFARPSSPESSASQ